MAEKFILPELGENVEKGTISNVLVSKGDTISEGQSILEIETDKAVVEIPAPASGKVTKLSVSDGDTIQVGDLVLEYEAGASGNGGAPAQQEAPPEEPAKQESTQQASGKQEADAAPQKEEAPAPKAEPAKEPATAQHAEKGESGPPRGRPQLQVIEREAPAQTEARGTGTTASPSVRRMARELGIDLKQVRTADPSGRVTVDDLRRHARNGGQESAPTPQKVSAESGAPAPPRTPAQPAPSAAAELDQYEQGADKWGAVAHAPMNAIRKATMRNMAANWTNIPHVTHHDKADITNFDALKQRYAKQVEAAGGRFTPTAILIKAVAEALRRFPKFNASIDAENEQVVMKRYYHVGVAVDTPNGLLVPVIRDADQKSIIELCAELPALAKKARDRKLSLEEMQGGTFTISNIGGIGGTGFTPIIQAPEVAILGVSRSAVEPVYQNGAFAPRTMMPLSLSYDHRVIDGADAARFCRWLCEAIEQPWMLFFE